MNTTIPLCFLLFASPLCCQEQPDAAPPSKAPEVTAALRAALTRAEASWTAQVSRRGAGNSNAAAGITVVCGAPTSEPFRGRVDVHRRGGAMLIASHAELPGVAVFDDGSTRITRTTIGSDPIDATTLAGDLPDLLRTERLLRECEAAEWRVEPAGDGTRATARLRKNLIPSAGAGGSPFAMLARQVDRVQVTVTLDGSGAVAALEFAVVRFDPNAAMQRRLLENGGADMGAVGPEALQFDESEREESDYEQDVYELRPKSDPMGERSTRLWEELAAVARKDGF